MDGFTKIWPAPDAECRSPWTGKMCPASRLVVPGMWTLFESHCPDSKRDFLVDAPYGLGLISPVTVDPQSGEILSPECHLWYRMHTENAFRNRSAAAAKLVVTRRRRARRACFVNVCAPYYGDCISLLFRIARLKESGLDVVLLAPSAVRPFIPDWVAEVWEVQGSSIGKGSPMELWSDGLAEEVSRLVAGTEECFLPNIFQPAVLKRDQVADFTRVEPFDRSRWGEQSYVVGVLWRGNRFYPPEIELPPKLVNRLERVGLSAIARLAAKALGRHSLNRHVQYLDSLAAQLRSSFPGLQMRVLGHGTEGGFGPLIDDRRQPGFGDEADLAIASEAAKCHVLISAHGSHLVPFSPLPGALVQMFPDGKWGNYCDTLINTCEDPGESSLVLRNIPSSTPVQTLRMILEALLTGYPEMHYCYHRDFSGLLTKDQIRVIRALRPQSRPPETDPSL